MNMPRQAVHHPLAPVGIFALRFIYERIWVRIFIVPRRYYPMLFFIYVHARCSKIDYEHIYVHARNIKYNLIHIRVRARNT